MDEAKIVEVFTDWWKESDDGEFDWLNENKPLLAHYTSMDVAEKILRHDEIWFSNPTYMNDYTEMVVGIERSTEIFFNSDEMSVFQNNNTFDVVEDSYRYYMKEFRDNHMLDVYVFCLSEHDLYNNNGLLSMWRGYGAQGDGVALVLNTGFASNDESPLLILSRVHYLNNKLRDKKITNIIRSWFQTVKSTTISAENLHIPIQFLFQRLILLALTVKHEGFREEREWRIIYLPQFDKNDLLKAYCDYAVTRNGIEAKLKLPIKPLPNSGDSWAFTDILEYIIIGPTASSILSKKSFCRMLERLGKGEFKNKVLSSDIPLRK